MTGDDLIETFERAVETYRDQTCAMDAPELTGLLGVESHWDAEIYMLDHYPQSFQDAGCISDPDQLEAIVLWKFPINVRHTRELSSERIRAVTKRAFAETEPRAMATELTDLKGIGPSIATAILTFYDPEQYTVMDPRATSALVDLDRWSFPSKAKLGFYDSYLQTCRELATDLGLSLRDLDRALWVLGGDDAPPVRSV